jgi:hypothetical protein
MNLKVVTNVLLSCSLSLGPIASAQERHEHEDNKPAVRPAEERPATEHAASAIHATAPRFSPPRFVPHPAGVRPTPKAHVKGPTVRPHAVRVLGSRLVVHENHQWPHWSHPSFDRPLYYWDWDTIHGVSCIAEDSYGDQYPVSESAFPGLDSGSMMTVEDDAIDRCYSESGKDTSCYLATCSHY